MTTSPTPVETLTRLSKAILESPIQFMSVDELEGGLKLSEPEFLARLEMYVKDPEVSVPSDAQHRLLIAGLLAKRYAKGLHASVVQKYVMDVPASKPPTRPLKPGAKKRKIAELRRKLKTKPIRG
jgi:hypothetical protein